MLDINTLTLVANSSWNSTNDVDVASDCVSMGTETFRIGANTLASMAAETVPANSEDGLVRLNTDVSMETAVVRSPEVGLATSMSGWEESIEPDTEPDFGEVPTEVVLGNSKSVGSISSPGSVVTTEAAINDSKFVGSISGPGLVVLNEVVIADSKFVGSISDPGSVVVTEVAIGESKCVGSISSPGSVVVTEVVIVIGESKCVGSTSGPGSVVVTEVDIGESKCVGSTSSPGSVVVTEVAIGESKCVDSISSPGSVVVTEVDIGESKCVDSISSPGSVRGVLSNPCTDHVGCRAVANVSDTCPPVDFSRGVCSGTDTKGS